MKARSKELLDRAIAATIAAIEIYNKPDFRYREEAFAVLAINGWELLLKAKWLADHRNDLVALYVREPIKSKTATKGKKPRIKRTRSGNPFTHSLDFLAKRLVESGALDANAWKNLEALLELRDSAIHFYNRSPVFAQRLQEIGAASVKNFAAAAADWFKRDLSEFNFYLMPLSFVQLPTQAEAVVLNPEEKNFLAFLEGLEAKQDDPAARYSVCVNIEIKFTRSKAKDALGVQITNNPDAPEVRLTEEQVREKYPWDYDRLTAECRKRYTGFKLVQKFHDLRRALATDARFGHVRHLDPGNLKSSKKPFFNPNILAEFDKIYTRA
jgi:hypothetical protein